MLSTAPTIKFNNRAEMDTRVRDQTQKLLEKVLDEAGYCGIWDACSVKRHRASKDAFTAQCVFNDPHRKRTAIKCYTMPVTSDKDTAYEVYLYPPSDYDINDVFAVLDTGQQHEPATKCPEIPKVSAEPEIITDKAITIDGLEYGKPYWGTVVNVTEFGAFVELAQGIQGMVHVSNWHSGRYIQDLRKEAHVGQRIVVVVMGRKPDGKIQLCRSGFEDSKEAADAESDSKTFTGIPDEKGHLRLKGYSDDPARMSELLTELALHWDEAEDDHLSSTKIQKIWRAYIRNKYNAKTTPVVSGLFNKMVNLDWMHNDYVDEDNKKYYTITEEGWRELGGRDGIVGEPKPSPALPSKSEIEDEEEPDILVFEEDVDEETGEGIDVEQDPEQWDNEEWGEEEEYDEEEDGDEFPDDDFLADLQQPEPMPDKGMVQKYVDTLRRVAVIESQISKTIANAPALLKEYYQLMRWLDDNPNAKTEVERMKQLIEMLEEFKRVFK